ncbi:MAG: phosphocholine cytidylyltransferase family protein [Bacteroidetes bacterium]|nr:phosphocholine cytidylyltransferase family protein [Bacteroidota bacterium]
MTALILAAGVASRMRPLTDTTPKCLLTLGEKTILQRTVDNLLANGIGRFVFVTGYLREQIEDFVANQWPGLDAVFIHNPVYDATNNIYSLWLAKDAVAGGDMLLLDSDILFDHRIVGALLASPYADCIALNCAINVGEEEIKVRLDGDGRIREISKVVSVADAVGESIGIERFSAPFTAHLYEVLERMIVADGRVDIFYEAAFEEVIREGRALYAVDISAYPCMELDTVEDLRRAEQELIPLLDC